MNDECAFDRRSFLKGLAVSAVGAAGVGALSSCAPKTADAAGSGDFSFADTVSWDGQYDVVVVGFGAAGAVAAKTAADEGAEVLLLDKAPLGHEGGNSRYCGQLFMYGNGDEEASKAYFKAMCGELPVPEDIVEVFGEGVAHLADAYAEMYDLDKNDFLDVSSISAGLACIAPEYPELAGCDAIRPYVLHKGFSDAYMWQQQRKGVTDMKDKIDVWLETPATRLIQDPQTKTVVGVEVERKGETLNIRANNGVVLTCGGFENNREMVKDYLGIPHHAPIGTLYNTGDGINMAQGVGADLWHMHAFEAMTVLGGMSYAVPEGERAAIIPATVQLHEGSAILVGTDGYRYLREDGITRHGHVYRNGVWESVKHPDRCFIVYDQAKADAVAAQGAVPEEVLAQVLTAPSSAELAALMGAKEDALEQTIADFNAAASAGHDPAYNRSAASMQPFDDGPYYALEVIPDILNTQGGPRRTARAEIVDVKGEPIPHLYSAGELGGITSNMYQGGGNMAECMIFGRIAGKNAAEKKEELPAYKLDEAKSSLTYTLGKETDIAEEATYETAEGEYLGKADGLGGTLVVKVKMDGSKMAAIEVLEQSETPNVGGEALKKLPQMVIDAQSVDIDAVSGATVTSKAFFAAVSEAKGQASQ